MIEAGQWMLDLFREESSRGDGEVEWTHESCARGAIQSWLMKKRRRVLESSPESTL